MSKKLSIIGLGALLALPMLPGVATAQEAKSDFAFSANMGLFSDYRFRGISQTNKKPAIQGGFEVAHSSGLYVGNWNSNVDSGFYSGANIEMDFYGGFRGELDDFGYDAGVIYYYYPGSSDPKIYNAELYLKGSYKWFSASGYYAVTDFFSAPDSDGSYYIEATVKYPVAEKWQLVGHIGYQGLKGGAKVTDINGSGPYGSITDWLVGITYDYKNWIIGASYIATNRDLQGSVPGRNISGNTLVVSVSTTF
jgi:uncharacterized protein (TIGR02001 family)